MIDKELFVCGINDRKSAYKMLLHIGEYKDVNNTYEAMMRGGKASGQNTDALFLFPFPPDDEVVEKFKLDKAFLQWLNEESKLCLKIS